ncbi:hypothetical protein V8F33_001937 [Rhypophila sp. PSN 637]
MSFLRGIARPIFLVLLFLLLLCHSGAAVLAEWQVQSQSPRFGSPNNAMFQGHSHKVANVESPPRPLINTPFRMSLDRGMVHHPVDLGFFFLGSQCSLLYSCVFPARLAWPALSFLSFFSHHCSYSSSVRIVSFPSSLYRRLSLLPFSPQASPAYSNN